ncbi:MAG: toprim domain-containing protein, partial [Synergistaceae bacterium]|nr:toprim domain-containing protein [Synergistaceae bacterium]
MGVDRIAYIKEHYSVLEYARDVLGLPVRKSGDRCTSIAPGPHKTNNAFVVYEDWWYDFSAGCGGDVIDLCAEAKHGGDKGEAIRELAGNYGLSENWKSYTEQLCDKIAYFHSKLRDVDREYLSKRGIKADTIERLKLGYDEKEDRLIIPYFKNGYVAYYIGRDRSGNPDASKYKKAKLDGLNENIAWGLHSFMPERRKEVREKVKDETKQAILEKYTVVAEGAFDVMSFEQDGFKVLSPISGYFNKETLKQVISLCKTQECVFICFDSDTAGTKFQINMAQQLFKHRVKFVCGTLPEGYKDISEYYEAGGNLFELVEKAKSGIAVLARQINDKDEFKKFVYQSARFVDEPDLVELFENVTQFSKAWLAALLKKALRPPTEKTIIQEIMAQRNLKYAEERGFFEYSHGVWKERSDNIIKSYIAERLGQYARGSNLST